MGVKLYVITDVAEHDLTYDRSLLVTAENPAEAILHWRAHYDEEDDEPERVFECDTSALELRRGPIRWHSDRLKQVAGKLPAY